MFDGRTAESLPVRLRLLPEHLEICPAEGGLRLEAWPYPALRPIGRLPDGSLRLALGARDEARLTVADPTLIAALAQAAPQILPDRPARIRRGLRHVASWGGVAAALWVCVSLVGPQVADAVARMLPKTWDEQRAAETYDYYFAPFDRCVAPKGLAALDRLTSRLAKAAGTDDFTVEVLDAPEVNAYALGGGRIVLMRGLIESAASAEEVAGVLAHEMGHEIEQHAARGDVRESGLDLVATLLLGRSDVGTVGSLMLGLGYSREFEREADARELELLAKAGIDAGGTISFFARLEREGGDLPGALAYLSTHPTSAERRAFAERHGQAGGPALPADEWAALRKICDVLDRRPQRYPPPAGVN
jgi:Zn-dependent protease with chaperone function